MSRTSLSFALLASSAFTAIAPASAFAQDSSFDAEDIVVTAQKRAQAIEDVPVTITALSGEFLRKLDATEFDEVALFTPGLVVQEQSPNNPGFVIRGITSDSGSAQIAPRVTIYYNGIDVSRSRGSYFDLFDVERIEVVKGPQSTLFGTAAAIGAVSVITNKAEEGFSAEANFTYGNYNYIETQGYINVGTDTIAGRIAWSYKDRDGFIDNVFPGPGSLDDDEFGRALNGQNVAAVRGSFAFTPAERFRADLIVSYEEQNPPGTPFKSGTFAPAGGDTSPFTAAALSGSPQSEEVLGLEEPGLERHVFDVNLTMRYDLNDNWKVTSITGYREFDSVEVFDADGSAAPYLEFTEDATGDQFSQEIRVNYDSGEGFSSFFGGTYFTEDGTQRIPFATEEGVYLQCAAGLVPNLGCVNADGVVTALQATSLLTEGAVSSLPYAAVFGNTGAFDIWTLYADVAAELTERFELSFGGRYVNESRTSGEFNDTPNSVITGAPLLGGPDSGGQTLTSSADFSDWLIRANALYRLTDEVNLYATVGRGRRSDVIDITLRNTRMVGMDTINVPTFADAEIVPAEIIWNYEVGVKGKFFGGKAFGALSVFYQDYTNFQTTQPELDQSGNPTGIFVAVNAGNATNIGVEAEFTADLSDTIEGLSIFGNAAYIDAEIDADEARNVGAQRFRLQPKWTASAGALYEAPITDTLNGFATLSWTYEGQRFFEIPNDPNIAEDAYSLVNLRAGIKDPEGRWQVDAFVTNLFDKEYIIDAGNTGGAFGIPTFIAGAPRFYGIRISGSI